jgi:4'-phosphopantetheinyl transferase
VVRPNIEASITLFDLDASMVPHEIMLATLDDVERARAARFVFEKDRMRFVAGRYRLRTLLASRLKTEAKTLHFTYGQYGKPSLGTWPELKFNLSHSNNWALLVLTDADVQIGIDIEQGKTLGDQAGMFAHCLCQRELELIREIDSLDRLNVFFSIWARKEAALKTHGLGFAIAPKRFDSMFGMPSNLIDLPELPPVYVTDLTARLSKTVQCHAAIGLSHSLYMPTIQLNFCQEDVE